MNINHVVLLVGTNPLPNYVVAQYLLTQYPDFKTISLVYSKATNQNSGTRKYADSIAKLLKGKHSQKTLLFEYVELTDVSKDTNIKNDICDKLLKKCDSSTHLHLNYTGGTKAMVTHIYQMLNEAKDKLASVSFSYLDARSFSLRFDGDAATDSEDLRAYVSLTLDELIHLHDFKKKKGQGPPAQVEHPEAVSIFRDLIQKNELKRYYDPNGGWHRSRFLNKNKPEYLASTPNQLKIETFNDGPVQEPFLLISRTMPVKIFAQDGRFDLQKLGDNWIQRETQETIQKENFETTIKFLDGVWLENYVLDVLQKATPDSPFGLGWVIHKDGWALNNDFELDVLFLNGYQLVAISCTTSSKKALCKSKGFEVLLRTKQIGGDESLSIVICRADANTVQQIESELKTDTGSQANIRVLGQDDLQPDRLAKEITDFVKGKAP